MESNSRLDRLFLLLSSGSNEATRQTAANQLGRIQATNPSSLSHLLKRLVTVFRSTQWEARVSASLALEAILKNVPEWSPEPVKKAIKTEDPISTSSRFEDFDLESVLQNGNFLVSESTSTDVVSEEPTDYDEQRRRLDKTLGLSDLGIKSEELFSNSDFEDDQSESKSKKSAREIKNRNRRRRVAANPVTKKLKLEKINDSAKSVEMETHEEEKEMEEEEEDPNAGPLDPFFRLMYRDLFHSSWEIRHGAATALRETIRLHASGFGKRNGQTVLEMEAGHKEWLRDMSIRLVCMISLDRFGDFVSDQVVAPVRETGAQALGFVLKFMDSEDVQTVVKFLLQLLRHPDWQCRHGGLLGMKYLLAVRPTDSLVNTLYPYIYKGLHDDVDDVVAVAASSLLPVVSNLISSLDDERLSSLTQRLWDSLLDLDDLTTSTQSLMKLLSQLLQRQEPTSSTKDLVPRIYPFLSHSSRLVRQSALEALVTLTSKRNLAVTFLPFVVKDLMLHLFQRGLIEHHSKNLELIEKLWKNVCDFTPLGPLLLATCPLYGPWLVLVSQPPNWPLQLVSFSTTTSTSLVYLGGPEAQQCIDSDEKYKYMMRARILACRLLGYLAGFVVQKVPDMNYTNENEPMHQFADKILLPNLQNSRSAFLRTTVCLVIMEWDAMHNLSELGGVPEPLKLAIIGFLNEIVSYDETISAFSSLQSEASDLRANLKHYDVFQEEAGSMTYERIQRLTELPDDTILRNPKIKAKLKTTLLERKKGITETLSIIQKEQSVLGVMTMAALAGAAISLRALPEKLNPVIKPLMESIKKETNEQLQAKSAAKLAEVMELRCAVTNSGTNDKVVKNLCVFVSSDPVVTPRDFKPDDILTIKSRERIERTSKKQRKGAEDSEQTPESNRFEIQRRGAKFALEAITKRFGQDLETKLPKLWDLTVNVVMSRELSTTMTTQEVINGLQTLEVMIPAMNPSLYGSLESAVRCLCEYHLCHESSGIRHLASRVISEISAILPKVVMNTVFSCILPMLELTTSLRHRQGSIESIACILEKMGLPKIVPYVVLLVVPVLGRMSDPDSNIRLLASSSFASLIRLMPLDSNEEGEGELAEKTKSERKFILQLMNSRNAEDFRIPVPILSATLRSYQQAGVNWLAFLNRYKLHGILCDDMGLGKTLQSICILASDHYLNNQENLPSLVVCPPTLGGHWKAEIHKFVDSEYLNPVLYMGNLQNRTDSRKSLRVRQRNLVVVSSYDIVRKDVDFLKDIKWNYIILDEGHVIKNAKTKTTLAIKQLHSSHRLILSGTPIQNSVLEIWSLFDFLMPGYLGTERQFWSKYSKPILASREPKCSKRDQEAGALAMESLHRQILPFVLRRMKEDVLEDLPPKITQDYYCDLSPLQVQLYEDFTSKQKLRENTETNPHVFQALQYLRKVCNHPKLVLDVVSPSDISVSAKLPALRDLLHECGIGIANVDNEVVSQHRALIFFQLKAMMDIVEQDLLKALMPSVTYLRMDGSVSPSARHDIVHRFNTDASIDLLLLSTSVGGLGLNLTGADTVIFAEHDWNPMKDLQAMDRAHRIGQKKVVNVYRLITRNTIEEKILGLQKFKLKTANTVISSENSSLDTMATDQLFDLFSLDESDRSNNGGDDSKKPGKGLKSLLENLPELWDDQQYENEYNISSFIDKNSE